jgi:ribonuclease HI
VSDLRSDAESTSSVLIFTDGACTGNPGPGGWASIVALPDGTVRELGGGVADTTNNRMELSATIHALAILEPAYPLKINLYTDSTYVIRGITQWIWGWRSKGWKNNEGKDVANRELWEELLRQVTRLKPSTIDWKYVRGHTGNPGNERCDCIAVSFATKKPEKLYAGPRDAYFVDLDELPEAQPVPDQKKSTSTAGGGKPSGGAARSSSGPTTYLSYLAGIVTRHSTWADCEKHVKGRSNAKFKKAKSAEEEKEILRSWGLDSSISIK